MCECRSSHMTTVCERGFCGVIEVLAGGGDTDNSPKKIPRNASDNAPVLASIPTVESSGHLPQVTIECGSCDKGRIRSFAFLERFA